MSQPNLYMTPWFHVPWYLFCIGSCAEAKYVETWLHCFLQGSQGGGLDVFMAKSGQIGMKKMGKGTNFFWGCHIFKQNGVPNCSKEPSWYAQHDFFSMRSVERRMIWFAWRWLHARPNSAECLKKRMRIYYASCKCICEYYLYDICIYNIYIYIYISIQILHAQWSRCTRFFSPYIRWEKHRENADIYPRITSTLWMLMTGGRPVAWAFGAAMWVAHPQSAQGTVRWAVFSTNNMNFGMFVLWGSLG